MCTDIKNTDSQPFWFLLNSQDPKEAEEILVNQNLVRYREGKRLFQMFVPYQFLKRRIANANPADEKAETDYLNPKNVVDVKANNELRSLLRRYIFVNATRLEIEELFVSEFTKLKTRSIFFSRSYSSEPLTVRDKGMEQFINACCDKNFHFEIWPAISGLEKNQEVILNTTEFRGQKAWVLEVNRRNGVDEVTVGFNALADTVLVKVPHLHEKDILFETKSLPSTLREDNRFRFIEDTQNKVLRLLENSFCTDTLTDVIQRHDIELLARLNLYRHRQYESPLLQAKHTALMLICAWLSNDRYDILKLSRRAIEQIRTLRLRPSDIPSQKMVPYLQSALYIATREPDYYESAISYYRTHGTLSGPQLKMVRAMRMLKDNVSGNMEARGGDSLAN
jgi:transcription antitermination factor NusG